MTADTLIKFQDKSAECKSAGHQCDFIGQMAARILSTDLDLDGAFKAVKSERAAMAAVAGLSGVKFSDSTAKQTVQDVRPATGTVLG